jgi:hypothetical protein
VLGNAPLSFESLLAIRTAKSRGHVGNEMKDILELFFPETMSNCERKIASHSGSKMAPNRGWRRKIWILDSQYVSCK